jgi:hypothetical protein
MKQKSSKLETRNWKQIRNSKMGDKGIIGFRISGFGFRVSALAFAFLAFQGFAATNISAGEDDLAKLRPPRAEIPATFWERYNVWIIIGSLVFLALIGIIIWIVTRPKPPVIVPPEIRARQAIEPLLSKPEDGRVLSQVSQILRRYITEAFALPPGELTTTEFCRLMAGHKGIDLELGSGISEFLRRCDERKFTPAPPAAPMTAAATALKLVETAHARLAEQRRRSELTSAP